MQVLHGGMSLRIEKLQLERPPAFHQESQPRNFRRGQEGVVEKCNFCEERLSQGLLPACVEACKEKALVFGDLKDPESEIRRALQNRTVYQRQPELGTKPKVYYIL